MENDEERVNACFCAENILKREMEKIDGVENALLNELNEVGVVILACDFVEMVVFVLNDVWIILNHFLDFSEGKEAARLQIEDRDLIILNIIMQK